MNKNILITGGLGFIGSNFIEYYLEKYPDHSIFNLDKLTYAGELSNLKHIKNNSRYKWVKGDICDKNLVNSLFDEYNFSGVIHFAAESHVDNSIDSPDQFINTNVIGTFNLIDVARQYWMNNPFEIKQG